MSDEIKLFRVSTGGASYWVLGESGAPDEMMRSIEEVEGCSFETEGWEKLCGEDIRKVPESEARKLTCKMEGEPDLDMWAAAVEHDRTGYGCVVACSEWP